MRIMAYSYFMGNAGFTSSTEAEAQKKTVRFVLPGLPQFRAWRV